MLAEIRRATSRERSGPAPLVGERTSWSGTTPQPVKVLRKRAYGPDEEVELPLSEIERLTQLGFLHDESRYMRDEEAARLPPQPKPPVAALGKS